MLFLCAVTIYPVLYVVSRSVMPDLERAVLCVNTPVLHWKGTSLFYPNSILMNGFKITLFRVAVGTTLSLVVEACLRMQFQKLPVQIIPYNDDIVYVVV